MKPILAILTLISGVIALLMTARMGYGVMESAAPDDNNAALIGFMLYSALFSMGAMALGLITYMAAKNKISDVPKTAKIGFGLGLLSILMLLPLLSSFN